MTMTDWIDCGWILHGDRTGGFRATIVWYGMPGVPSYSVMMIFTRIYGEKAK